jgi:protein arginine N-methyltransferase 1
MFEPQSSRTLDFHRFLLSQTRDRLERFERALRMTVNPGEVVLDLGTGMGILALLAIRAGARHVYAIESSDSIDFARAIAASEGVTDKITFIRGSSLLTDIPERAQVLITDTFGTFGLQPEGLTALLDARHRLLAANARCIPNAIQLCAAPVEDSQVYGQMVDTWSAPVRGVSVSPIRPFAVNSVYSARLPAAGILTSVPAATRLVLTEIEDVDFSLSFEPACARSGTMHGLCCWFIADLADGVSVDNAPGSSSTGYAHMFAPLSEPIALNAGDSVGISVQGYDNLHLRWRVAVGNVHFDQSTFFGFPVDVGSAPFSRVSTREPV